MTEKTTPIQELKFNSTSSENRHFTIQLRRAMEDKGYDPSALRKIARSGKFARILSESILRINPDQTLERQINDSVKIAFSERSLPANRFTVNYVGLPEQNKSIDSCIKQSPYDKDGKVNSFRKQSGKGALTFFDVSKGIIKGLSPSIEQVPVTLLGGGVSSVMVARALVKMGWRPEAIKIIEKSGKFGGIWNYSMVVNGSRNNPREINFLGRKLAAAPARGQEMIEFVQDLSAGEFFYEDLVGPIKGNIHLIEPGNLETKVHYESNGEKHVVNSPIVVNCLGMGKPLPISRKDWMTTSATNGGARWQQIITGRETAEKYRGKRIILIGLGNSTAEMLTQIQKLNKEGYNIDYRVLTHYPRDAVLSPEDYVVENERTFRVFRDLSQPDLVDYQGDLEESRDAYFKALYSGKIIPEVTHWDVKNGKMHVKKRKGSEIIKYNDLFTLIGYANSVDALVEMGFKVHEDKKCCLYDYDGEAQKRPHFKGRNRVYAGYFGFGSVLNTPENKNSIVIPGMMHRIGDLIFGIVMRAYEYKTRKD